MDIKLFGALQIDAGGRRLSHADLGGVKPKEILEILVLARGALVSKEALADALWPETRPRNVTATLETYVSVLRRRVTEDRSRARQLVVTSAGAYRFAPEGVSLDIDRFDDLVRRAERAGRRERVALRVQAAAIATGDLLEDAPYAAWAEHERQLYRDRSARTNLLVAEDLLVDGDLAGALRHGEVALRLNPFAEEGFRVVMLANHALGHTERARGTFQRCRTLLGDELGVDPSTGLVDLAGAIDAGAPVSELLAEVRLADQPSAPVRVAARSQAGGDRRSPLGRLPFVGRRAEVERITAHVRASQVGRCTLVLVEGRQGVGRTALLDHLRGMLPGVVGHAAYTPLEVERPALPLSAALVDALGTGPAGADAARYAGSPWLSGEDDALQDLLAVLSAHAPLTLLLDDLQWVDPATFVALEWLHRRAPELALTVVGAVRASPGGGAFGWGVLSVADTIRLTTLDTTSPELDGIDPELARATGGDPALLADCWRWVQVHGGGVPPSVRQAILRTVRGLGGSYPRLLQAAATLPEPFDLLDLMVAVDTSTGEALGQVERLCELDVLRRVPEGFCFTAAVARTVLADTVVPAQAPAPSPGAVAAAGGLPIGV
jgi:DNA-binding SARP family transcriptional activator